MSPNTSPSCLARAALAVCTLSLAACAAFPERESRAQMKPAQRYASTQAFAAPAVALGDASDPDPNPTVS